MLLYVFSVALCCLCSNALVPPLEGRKPLAPTVTISNGVIVGTTTRYVGATAINNKFLGIPFAISPPLRFGMPEPAVPWSAPLVATTYKPACPQASSTPGSIPSGVSEDCLYLNVYSPAGTTPRSKKAVMFWVYGGNLQAGTANINAEDGSSFAAQQDVVLVTFGYRVNAFGFSNAPEIPVSQQNVGFYDQRLALDWVQHNIHAFGGDPSKVTIFGESAGGYSVKYLVRLPPRPLPYRAAIIESEATIIVGNGTQSWNLLAAQLGCTGSSTLACVRAADAAAVESVITNQSLGFPPVEDRTTFVHDVFSGFANDAANVPVLIGTNGQEASVIPYLLGLEGLGTSLINVLNTLLLNNSVYIAVGELFTSIGFQCDARHLTQTLQDSGRPVWRYYYNASFPNDMPFPFSGAYHGSEIAEVYGTYSRTNVTAQQKNLSKYMQTAWADFAKNPTTGPGWESYGAAQNVGNIGSNGNSGEETISAAQIDRTCILLGPLGGINNWVASVSSASPLSGALEGMLRFNR